MIRDLALSVLAVVVVGFVLRYLFNLVKRAAVNSGGSFDAYEIDQLYQDARSSATLDELSVWYELGWSKGYEAGRDAAYAGEVDLTD